MKIPYVPTLALLLGTASIASAEDVVTLDSGHRMTGEIRELTRGELSFRIAGVGRVDIDMNEVVRIGPATERRFVEGLSGSIDVGFDFLSANDEVDWTINGDIERRTKRHLTEVQLSSLLRRRDSDTAQRRNHFEIGSRRFNEARWFVLGQFHAEENHELDLDSRFLLGAALGRTLSQSNRAIVSMYAGADASREEFRGYESDTVWEVHGALEWEWFEPSSDNGLDFRTIVYYAPDESRTRVEA